MSVSVTNSLSARPNTQAVFPGSDINLTIRKLSHDYLEFELGNVHSAMANSLRRILLAEVPMLAIHEIIVRTNTSVLHDEFLAQRLGMIPIASSQAKDMNFYWNCPCNKTGCTRCTVEMELSARCRIDDPAPREVTASDLHVLDQMNTGDVYPVLHPNNNGGRGPLLVTLGPGQEIDILCRINKGIAKEHAKWMPLATVSMQYMAHIELNMDELKSLEDKRELVSLCPVRVFDVELSDIRVKNPERCVYCSDCCSREGKKQYAFVKRKQNPSNGHYYYVFRLEGIGVLPVLDILREGLAVLKHKFLRFEQAMGGEQVEVPRATERGGELGVAPLVEMSPAAETPMTNMISMVFS